MSHLRPLLVISIGNPTRQYASTLHSAGHTVLETAHALLGRPAWQAHQGGHISRDIPADIGQLTITGWKRRSERPEDERDWTLWKSGSLMNVSGKGVLATWKAWVNAETRRKELGRLVIVHDELERDLGSVRVVSDAMASARGHNGIKSIQSSLNPSKIPFTRIGIGIGRPASREPDVVARYVLRKMDAREKAAIEGAADPIIRLLESMEEENV